MLTGAISWTKIYFSNEFHKKGWILDTEAMEWKRIVFKASVTGQKGSMARRMTGLIQDRPLPRGIAGGLAGGSRSSSSKFAMKGKISFVDLAGAMTGSKSLTGSKNSRSVRMSVAQTTKSSWQNVLKSKMSTGARASITGATGGMDQPSKEVVGGPGAFHEDLVNVVSQGFGSELDSDQPANVRDN